MTGVRTNNQKHPLAYGSAQLDGYKYQDFVCLKPLNTTQENLTQDMLNSKYCIRDLRF